MKGNEVYDRLTAHGIKPSVQRLEIMKYLMTHHTHPTVEDVYTALCKKIPTLSRTTVYNTLRMFAEHKAAQMLTIDERRVCYDSDTSPHVHLFCRNCGKVMDMMGVAAPVPSGDEQSTGWVVDETHLYYKGLCPECSKKLNNNN